MITKSTSFDLLIFDLDGTLVDTRQDLANAVNFALRQLGREEVDIETVTGYVGDGVRKLVERALGDEAQHQLEEALNSFWEFYTAHIADFSRPYPGVKEMLSHFRTKKKAIVTNKPQELTEALLRKLELYEHFEMILGGKDGRKLKPAPEAIYSILENTSVSPKRAIMIGDGENDILAGKAAGIATCAVTYGYRPAEKLLALRPDFVVRHMEEIRKIAIP